MLFTCPPSRNVELWLGSNRTGLEHEAQSVLANSNVELPVSNTTYFVWSTTQTVAGTKVTAYGDILRWRTNYAISTDVSTTLLRENLPVKLPNHLFCRDKHQCSWKLHMGEIHTVSLYPRRSLPTEQLLDLMPGASVTFLGELPSNADWVVEQHELQEAPELLSVFSTWLEKPEVLKYSPCNSDFYEESVRR